MVYIKNQNPLSKTGKTELLTEATNYSKDRKVGFDEEKFLKQAKESKQAQIEQNPWVPFLFELNVTEKASELRLTYLRSVGWSSGPSRSPKDKNGFDEEKLSNKHVVTVSTVEWEVRLWGERRLGGKPENVGQQKF